MLFRSRTERRFESGEGFYSWRDLKYFLYEYEFRKATINKILKIDWNLFTRIEKEKVTIEHILPQTPTMWYWRNTYRAYSEDEIKLLSASLGNLLPLSQSINSSLQNDGFPDKKNPSIKGRRGYINGSHSEIEVAQEDNWTASNILRRGLNLLDFMESRWDINFSDEQKSKLLHIDFVNNIRDEVAELPETEVSLSENTSINTKIELQDRHYKRIDFWNNFVSYCKANGRGHDIVTRKPGYGDWYDVSIESHDYHIFFQLYHRKVLRIGLYVYKPIVFSRLESIKEEIENTYGSELEWYTSRKKSEAKRILHSIDADIHNQNLYEQHFKWLITQYDKLHHTIKTLDRNQ